MIEFRKNVSYWTHCLLGLMDWQMLVHKVCGG